MNVNQPLRNAAEQFVAAMIDRKCGVAIDLDYFESIFNEALAPADTEERFAGVIELVSGPDGVEEQIVIRNEEQVEIMNQLASLKADCDAVLHEAAEESDDNESLYAEPVIWSEVRCARTERWLDDEGNLGWRVSIVGASNSSKRLMAYVSDKLLNRGWEGVIAEAAW